MIAAWIMAFGGSADAATMTWTGTFSDLWSTGGNWTGGATPANGDNLVFSGSARTPTWNDILWGTSSATGTSTIQSISFASNAIAYTATNQNIAVNVISNSSSQNQTFALPIQLVTPGFAPAGTEPRLAVFGAGDVILSGSVQTRARVSITGTAGGGAVKITGTMGAFPAATDIYVGGTQTPMPGRLLVTGSLASAALAVTGTNGITSLEVDGGSVSSQNILDIGGNRATFMIPGVYEGNGALSIINGGKVYANGLFTVGGSGSNGQSATMLVDGIGSRLDASLNADRTWLGLAGQMSGTISNGASVLLGRDFFRTVNNVGATGTAAISILSGGTLGFNGEAYFGGGSTFAGPLNGGSATVLVDGTGSTLVLGNGDSTKYFGYSGRGTLTVQNGGAATFVGPLVLGNTSASVGILNVAGGSVSATTMTLGNLVGASGTVNFGTGGSLTGVFTGTITSGSGTGQVNFNSTANQSTSGVLAGSSLSVSQLGSGTTTLTGSNTFAGGVTISAGALNAGSATALGSGGTITFGGGNLQYSASNQVDYSSRFSTAAGQQVRIDTNSQNVTFASSLTSSGGSLTKLGAGTLTVNGTNSYSGGTTVSAGTLKGTTRGLQGSIANAGTVEFSQAFTGTYAGVITGTGGISKSDTGAVSLTNANAFTGPTSIVAGLLAVNGDQSAATGLTTVGAAGTLAGTGTIGGSVVVNGLHAPGNSPGVQTINGDLTYNASSSVLWELIANTTGGTGTFDQIAVPNGNLTFAGATALGLSFNGTGSTVDWSDTFWSVNRSWLVVDLSAGVTTGIGNFSVTTADWLDSTSTALSTSRSGATFNVSLAGQDVLLNYVAPVPEPSALALTAAATAGLWVLIRRKRA